MITYREIEAKAMPPEKREQCKDDWFSFYVGRKLSYWLTIPFLHTSLTPNHVTFLSILALIVGFIVNCFANAKGWMVLAWLCYFLWNLLDGVDGNMARYRGQFSKLGDIYDTMGGYAAYALVFLGMGIGAWLNPGGIERIPGPYYIVLGAVSSISSIFPRLIYQKIKASLKDSVGADNVRRNESFIRKLEMNVTSITGGATVFSFIAIITGSLDVFTLVYAFLNVMKMILSLRAIFRETEKSS